MSTKVKPERERQTEFVGLNLTSAVKAAAQAAADADKRTLADWVRVTIEAALAAKGKGK